MDRKSLMQNSYCIRYKAKIFSMSQPSRPRGHIWAYRQNTDVRYTMDTVVQDFQKKHPQYVVGEIVMTFHARCPVSEEDVYIELYDADGE